MSIFSFLNFKKTKNNYSLVFDIGAGSVAASLVKFTDKPGFRVIYSVRELIQYQEKISSEKYLTYMITALNSASEKIQKQLSSNPHTDRGGKMDVSRAFMIFSSPWCISQTKIIKVQKDKPFELTKKVLEKIILDEENLVKKDIESTNMFKDIKSLGDVIEKKIVQTKINGYKVDDPYGKVIKELELSLFVTVVPKEILKTVKETYGKYFAIKEVWSHSLTLASFTTIRDFYPNQKNFVQIDINEEITEVSIIKDGVIISTSSIPIGRNYFVRIVASENKVTSEIADSMIKMHCDGSCEEGAAVKLEKAMSAATDKWIANLKEIFNSFIAEIYIPKAVFFVASNDFICFISNKLKESRLAQFGISNESFEILSINHKSIKDVCKMAIQKDEDVILKIEELFLDKIYNI